MLTAPCAQAIAPATSASARVASAVAHLTVIETDQVTVMVSPVTSALVIATKKMAAPSWVPLSLSLSLSLSLA
jgi:hypothetical protein